MCLKQWSFELASKTASRSDKPPKTILQGLEQRIAKRCGERIEQEQRKNASYKPILA